MGGSISLGDCNKLMIQGDKTSLQDDPFVLMHDYGNMQPTGSTAQRMNSKIYSSTHTVGKFFKGSGKSSQENIKPLLKNAFERM